MDAKEVYAFLPHLKNEIGHSYEYSRLLERAAAANRWRYFAWVSQECELENLPPNWQKKLQLGFWKKGKSYFSILKGKNPSLLFLEQFQLLDLTFLCFACLILNKKLSLALVLRYLPRQLFWKGKLHAAILHFFAKVFGKKRLHLFTDSELLQKKLQQLVSQDVKLLPIPHGKISAQEKFCRKESALYCWWPGGDTREAKGLQMIVELSQLLQKTSSIYLVAAKNVEKRGIFLSSSLILVEDRMDRLTYEKWMHTVDVILLPYDPQVYQAGTSGIFVEAIQAGKIPLVTDGTWMAEELKKHDLSCFIIDWQAPFLLKRIQEIARDVNAKKKLHSMQKAYQAFHSLENFARALKEEIDGDA